MMQETPNKDVEAPNRVSLDSSDDGIPGIITIEKPISSLDKGFWVAVGAVLVSVFGIIIILAVSLSSDGSNTDGNLDGLRPLYDFDDDDQTNSTNTPTTIVKDDLYHLMAALQGEESDLTQLPEDSPQAKALDWVLNEDEGYDIETTPHNLILERYVMVLLYYSCNGPYWRKQFNFLNETSSVCEWNDGIEGVLCDVNDKESPVIEIHLDWNNLAGQLPTELKLLSDLEYLDLHNNRLHGTIPSQLEDLSALGYLNLASNDLSGELDSQLGLSTSLSFLDLYNNEFSGQLPKQLSQVTSLAYLSLGWNNMHGTIPSEYGSMTSLTHLSLSDNDLSGEIPPTLDKLSHLQFLALSDNQSLGGDMESICNSGAPLFTVTADCNDASNIQCSCCTDCY